jgi:nucleotide-binding universal stress UspA family protein
MKIQHIICPVDFSDASRHAIDHATMLARWYAASISILHVYTPVPVAATELARSGAGPGPLLDEYWRVHVRAELDKLVAPAVAAGIECESIATSGSIVDAILETAAAYEGSVIVMGTHGTGGIQHLILGSVTEKVLRKASSPVMVIPPLSAGGIPPYKRILCPIDFSDPSLVALDVATSLAKESGAKITLLHVLESPSMDEPIVNRSFNVPEFTLLRDKDARKRLDEMIPDVLRDTYEPAIAHGKPYREILRASVDERADLIVMGVHGRNALEIMLFGSTTNQVVRRATCPVMTLRA